MIFSNIYKSFWHDVRGGLTLELSILLPLLIALLLGSFAYSDAFLTQSRVLRTNFAIADAIARKSEVTSSFLHALAQQYSYRARIDPDNIQYRISSIAFDPTAGEDEDDNGLVDGAYVAQWSITSEDISNLVTNPELIKNEALTESLPIILNLDELIFVESFVNYQIKFASLITPNGLSNITFTNKIAAVPRQNSRVILIDIAE